MGRCKVTSGSEQAVNELTKRVEKHKGRAALSQRRFVIGPRGALATGVATEQSSSNSRSTQSEFELVADVERQNGIEGRLRVDVVAEASLTAAKWQAERGPRCQVGVPFSRAAIGNRPLVRASPKTPSLHRLARLACTTTLARTRTLRRTVRALRDRRGRSCGSGRTFRRHCRRFCRGSHSSRCRWPFRRWRF